MAAFSQTEIDELIACPKEITHPPQRELRLDGAHYRKSARLIASDESRRAFSFFIRQNADFPENFSVGLSFHPQDGRDTILLVRCNGKHGDFNNSFDPDSHHCDFHVHRATEQAIEHGFAAEKFADKTSEYASLDEAIQYFVKLINLNEDDRERYFPSNAQLPITFPE